MSSLYRGLAESHRNSKTPNINRTDDSDVFMAQVLEVVKNSTSLTEVPQAVGAIRFNVASLTKKPEGSINNIALPLDRSSYRLPTVGEQVLIARQGGQNYYFAVATSFTSMAVNIDPNLFLNAFESSGGPAIAVDPAVEKERFIVRNDFDQKTLLSSSSLFSRVREGETIMEGRMGGVIKLTHTITKEGVWDTEKQIVNLGQSTDGDPMLIMKSNIRRKLATEIGFIANGLEDDDINEDGSSFYLTTTQVVPVQLATSSTMYSWAVEVNKLETQALADDESVTLESFFPDKYDPNEVLSVNVTGFNLEQGAQGGVSGPVDGTNGKLSPELLMDVGFGSNRKLSIEAGTAFMRMADAARAVGITPNITDGYRTYATQDRIFDWDLYVATGGNRNDDASNYNRNAKKRKKDTNGTVAAAFPGKSNHGLGIAIDAKGAAWKKFIRNRGVEFGWSWFEGRSVNEDWHFTYSPSNKEVYPLA